MSPEESNTDVIDVSSDDDESSVELTKEDKTLILRLVTTEFLGETQEPENSVSIYKCIQKCTVCSENKPNFPTDESLLRKLFEQRNGVFLTKEDREAINRDLVHNFFKQKWEARNEKIETAQDDIRTESNQSKVKKERDENEISTNEKHKNHKCNDVTQYRIQNGTHVEETNKVTFKQELSLIQQQIPLANQDRTTVNISSTKSFHKLSLEPSSAERKPMDDPEGPFFIDKECLDVEMYEDGLKKDRWNPTQSLHEISTKCGWSRPDYTITRVDNKKNPFPCFVCEIVINGKSFMTDRAVMQKKTAQHLASAKFLNYIGFEFQYTKGEEAFKTPIPRNEDRFLQNPMKINKAYSNDPRRSNDRSFEYYHEYRRHSSFRRNKDTENDTLMESAYPNARRGSKRFYWQKSLSIEKFGADDCTTQDHTCSLQGNKGSKVRACRSSSPEEEVKSKRSRKRSDMTD